MSIVLALVAAFGLQDPVDYTAVTERLAGQMSIEALNECAAIHLYDEQRLADAIQEAEGERLARLEQAQGTQDLMRTLWLASLRIEIEAALETRDGEALVQQLRDDAQALIQRYEGEGGAERLKTARRTCTDTLMSAIRDS